MKFQYNLSQSEGSIEVLATFNERVSNMSAPHAIRTKAHTETKAFDVLEQASLIASHQNTSCDTQEALYTVLRGPSNREYLVYANSGADLSLDITVCGNGPFAAMELPKVLQDILNTLTLVEILDDGAVNMRFWYWDGRGPSCTVRRISVPVWGDISPNYTSKARDSLDSLMRLEKDSVDGGKLLLLHGDPGTGKTTAIRALAHAWRDWCSVEYVVDPERAFGEANYLVNLLLSNWDETPKAGIQVPKWRLVIIEDAEEFLAPNAKTEVGQSVARLLNFGDGLIGQGLRILIMLTTNAPFTKLHPAITRPGRCLANIEVPPFTPDEASTWLGEQSKEATLAQLYERRNLSQIESDAVLTATPGQYL